MGVSGSIELEGHVGIRASYYRLLASSLDPHWSHALSEQSWDGPACGRSPRGHPEEQVTGKGDLDLSHNIKDFQSHRPEQNVKSTVKNIFNRLSSVAFEPSLWS